MALKCWQYLGPMYTVFKAEFKVELLQRICWTSSLYTLNSESSRYTLNMFNVYLELLFKVYLELCSPYMLNFFNIYIELVQGIRWILKVQGIHWICSKYMLNCNLSRIQSIRWTCSPYTLNLFTIYVEFFLRLQLFIKICKNC